MRIKTVMAALTLLMLGPISFAQQNVVGYNKIDLPGGFNDTKMTVPFTTTPYDGSGNPNPSAEFTVSGFGGSNTFNATIDGGLTPGKFSVADPSKDSYYVRFTTGNASGLWMSIKGNDANGFQLDDRTTPVYPANQDQALQRNAIASKLQVGDKFRVYKHHTVASLFPSANVGLSHVAQTTILLYGNGIDVLEANQSAYRTVNFSGTAWSNPTAIIAPETEFRIRTSAAVTRTLQMVTYGTVPDYEVSLLVIKTAAANQNDDHVIGTGYPVPVVLREANMGGNGRYMMMFNNNDPVKEQNRPAKITRNFGGGKWNSGNGDDIMVPSQSIKFRTTNTEAATPTVVTIRKPY